MKEIKTVLEGIYNNPELRKTIVPLFIGNPGLGKTVMIEQFAKDKGVQLIEIITSQVSPFEVSGICIPDKDTKQMMYYNLDRLENLKDGDILFFDELLNGNPIVLNACLTMLEQRRFISGKNLPDIMIVAASNWQGMCPLTPQIKERFVWYDVKFNSNLWNEFMTKKYNLVPSIISKLVSLITKEDFTGNNFNTPRSIDKAINMLIHNIPTPYSHLEDYLSELIENTTNEPIYLSENRNLEVNEKIRWIDLIKYKKNCYIESTVPKNDDVFVCPEKWCVKNSISNESQLIYDYANIHGSKGPYTSGTYFHFPSFDGCTTSQKSENQYTEITFEQFKTHILKV